MAIDVRTLEESVKPDYRNTRPEGGRFKAMPYDLQVCVASTIKALLHASRDCLRNQRRDTKNIRFHVGDGYYGEAFGIMRGLEIQGYGYFGPTNIDGTKDIGTRQATQNFKWWFAKLEDEVLEEEHYNDGGGGRCEHCLEKYGKDDKSYYENLRRQSGGEPVFKLGRYVEGDE